MNEAKEKRWRDTILNESCVLVCGSGISSPIFPDVNKLIEKLNNKANCDLTLQNSASQTGRKALRRLLHEEYCKYSATVTQKIISILPWKYIITTNYDMGLFQAFSDTGQKPPKIVATDRDYQHWDDGNDGSTVIFHPHGFVIPIEDNYIISKEDYNNIPSDRRRILDFVRGAIKTNPVVFIGYGMGDAHIIQSLLCDRLNDKKDKPKPIEGIYISRKSNKAFNEILKLANFVHISGKTNIANEFLLSIIKHDNNLYNNAHKYGLINEQLSNRLGSHQMEIYCDIDASQTTTRESALKAIRDNTVSTGLFYYYTNNTQAWLSLCEDNEYFFSDSLRKLQQQFAKQIVETIMNNKYNMTPTIISLGPGNGEKDVAIIKALMKHRSRSEQINNELRVLLVDISITMLGHSRRCIDSNIRNANDIKLKGLHTDIESLQNHKNIYDDELPKAFFMLGNTFGNFPNTEKLIGTIKECMNKDDFLILEVNTYEDINIENINKMQKSYNSKSMQEYLMEAVKIVNTEADTNSISIELTKATEMTHEDNIPNHIEYNGYYTHRNDKPLQLGNFRLSAGSKRKIFTSKSFYQEYIKSLLEDNGFEWVKKFGEGITTYIVLKLKCNS